jgi:hypothetical protein
MTLQRLARDLDETARQTALMVDGMAAVLELLNQPGAGCERVRKEAMRMIVHALEGQGRIERRLQNMALAVRQIALLPPDAGEEVYEEIWSSLVTDELRGPTPGAVAARGIDGEADLF